VTGGCPPRNGMQRAVAGAGPHARAGCAAGQEIWRGHG
jgi:hypothetical protein